MCPPRAPLGERRIPTSLKRARLARWLHGEGIELGALHEPLPVPDDASVSYVDRLAVEALRAQYPELSGLDLAPVSHIGSAEDLSSFADQCLDFVIACHLLEHLEDPTRGLHEIHRVLREGGIFYCALPDSRVTFDVHRDYTTVEHLLDDHPAGRASRREHFRDWVENVERHQPWWASSPRDVVERVDQLMEMDYSIHYHVWRPDTFLEYLFAACRRDGIAFEPVAFEACDPRVDNEFILLLRKGIATVPMSPPPAADEVDPVPVQSPSGVLAASAHLLRRAREEMAAGGPKAVARSTRRWLRRTLGG
jgi:predicted SAM-dependent methyltransferase